MSCCRGKISPETYACCFQGNALLQQPGSEVGQCERARLVEGTAPLPTMAAAVVAVAAPPQTISSASNPGHLQSEVRAHKHRTACKSMLCLADHHHSLVILQHTIAGIGGKKRNTNSAAPTNTAAHRQAQCQTPIAIQQQCRTRHGIVLSPLQLSMLLLRNERCTSLSTDVNHIHFAVG